MKGGSRIWIRSGRWTHWVRWRGMSWRAAAWYAALDPSRSVSLRAMARMGALSVLRGRARPWLFLLGVAGCMVPLGSTLRLDAPLVAAEDPGLSGLELGMPRLAGYRILGAGVRTVSFLRFKVYDVGIYVREEDLPKLRTWLRARGPTERLRETLLHPETTLFGEMLEAGVDLAICIVPLRNTDFAHLRDGFMRGIRKVFDHSPPTAEDVQTERAMEEFQRIFSGRGSCRQGSRLVLHCCTRSGTLAVLYDNKLLGKVNNASLLRALVLNYVQGRQVASEAARKSVVSGLAQLSEE